MAIYKLHLVAFYTVNECALVDLSEYFHGMKIYERLNEKSITKCQLSSVNNEYEIN